MREGPGDPTAASIARPIAYPRVEQGMSRRLLPAALLVTIACAVAIAIALHGENPGTNGDAGPAVAATLLQTGGGPAGSGVVTLTRWRYRADPAVRGRRAGWARGDWRGRPVLLPNSANAGAISGPAGARNYAGAVGWYARTIDAPVAGLYAIAFESAHYKATVFVDGRPAREHTGAYEPFSARVRLSRGRHAIVARVDWRDPARQAAQGWARGWFNYGGLNRPVTLARLGPTELGAAAVRTRLTGRRARVDVSVRVRNRGPSRTLHLRGALSRGDTTMALDFPAAGIGSGTSRTVKATLTIDEPALWSPADPRLYDLRIDDPGEATLQRRIGLREISWDAGGLALNHEPLVLRGAALPPDARGHGDALTGADEARIVAGLRAVGANATRSQMPLSQSMLDRLDAAGILVWQVAGPWEPAGRWRAGTPAGIAAARDRALRTVEAQQAHPAIVAWTLANEVSGQGQPGEREYIAQTARRLHAIDPGRPVAVDLWGSRLTHSGGAPFTGLDAIGMTDYVGWYDDVGLGPAGQAAVTDERISRLHRLFPDKPVVVTEFGAAGSDRTAPAAFGGLRFQAALLARRIGTLSADPTLSGMLIWSLRDYALRPDFHGGSVLDGRPGLKLAPGLNEKGLYDYAGRAKPALGAVRRAFAQAAG
ncbi:MAG: beta-galactosidase [Solirubrobacteraceae bacterium]|nr:beta-galactosidase [Solirubrobacteraceae bacterium]